MVCGNTKSGKIVIGTLILLTGIVLILLYIFFMSFSSSSKVEDGTRLHLSQYVESSNEFRVDSSRIKSIKTNIEKFLKPYDLANPNVFPNCDFIFKPPENKTCGVDIRKFGSCSNANNFGLNDDKPCIFVKFDSRPGWVPEYYNNSELPEDMPSDLKSTIVSNTNGNSKNLQTLWMSCEGATDEDKRSVGPINILPHRGFLGFYFDETSCKSENLCTDPLVAIQFQRIEKKKIEIDVRCQVWAKNANDTVEFKLYVD